MPTRIWTNQVYPIWGEAKHSERRWEQEIDRSVNKNALLLKSSQECDEDETRGLPLGPFMAGARKYRKE